MYDPTRYDPDVGPDPEEWLELDEDERIMLVLSYHRGARERLENAHLHASMHVVVENQVASPDLPVRTTLERLQAEGLGRHDAVHAIASVVASHLFEVMKGTIAGDDPHGPYWARLRELTAERWLRGD
jgi:hypothetical protein